VLVEIVLKLVCVGQDFKPTRIPADLRAAIEPLVAIPEEK
jgi:acyl-CoA thioesterase FadM